MLISPGKNQRTLYLNTNTTALITLPTEKIYVVTVESRET